MNKIFKRYFGNRNNYARDRAHIMNREYNPLELFMARKINKPETGSNKLLHRPRPPGGRRPRAEHIVTIIKRLGISGNTKFHFSDVRLLSQFLTKAGQILPKYMTGLNKPQQMKLNRAIKASRQLGFLPFLSKPNIPFSQVSAKYYSENTILNRENRPYNRIIEPQRYGQDIHTIEYLEEAPEEVFLNDEYSTLVSSEKSTQDSFKEDTEGSSGESNSFKESNSFEESNPFEDSTKKNS